MNARRARSALSALSALSLAALASFTLRAPAHAADGKADVSAASAMPAVIALGAQRLPARSCALRHTLWVEHYTTVLYLPGHAIPAEELTSAKVAKALRMQIINRRFIPADIPEKWREPMRKNLAPESMAHARQAFHDLKSGDRVVMSYQPESGVSVSVNDRVVATARGHGLIDSILETWTEDTPLRDKLQRTLARNPCPAGMVAGL
jgi:hypothetical protein